MKYLIFVTLVFTFSCSPARLVTSNPLERRVRENIKQFILTELDTSRFSPNFIGVGITRGPYPLARPFKSEKPYVSHVMVLTGYREKGISTNFVPLLFFINRETSQVDSVHFRVRGGGSDIGFDISGYGNIINDVGDIFGIW